MEKTANSLIDQFSGRMNSPTSSAILKGICGEEMGFYLLIEKGRIEDVKFYSEGCAGTKACAAMAASLALNKTVSEALLISAGEVIKKLPALPQEHLHCSILVVSVLYKAIADYLLQL